MGVLTSSANEEELTTKIIVKSQRILIQRLDDSSKAAERFPVHRVCVTRGVDIGARFMDLAVDGKSRAVDGGLGTARLHLAVLVHQHQIRDFDEGEVCAQRVDPEVLRIQGVAQGNVASHPLVETLVGEHSESDGQMLFLIIAGVNGVGELGR